MTVSARRYICPACTHFQPASATVDRARCAAFPRGIPDAILQGADHRVSFPGDKGILFNLDPTKIDLLVDYEEAATRP